MSNRQGLQARTVVELLRNAAQADGDREAYVEPAPRPSPAATGRRAAEPRRRCLSLGEWDRRADGVAHFLSLRGVSKGDVVAILLPSSIDFAVTYAAAMRLGAITSALNPRLGPAELASVVRRARPAVTVVDPALPVRLPPGCGTLVRRAEVVAAGESGAAPHPCTLHDDDPVAVVWTSGTGGEPKGAVFDHRNLAAVAQGTDILSRSGDRRLSPLPFAHVGYMTRAWDEIAHRITTVITPTPWRAAEALEILQSERITVGQGVPTQWRLLLDLPGFEDADLSSLRVVGTGASRVPEALVRELRHRLGVPVVVRYTSTESSLGTSTLPEDPDEVVATTVGRPVPGVDLRIVDDEGHDQAPGEVGRVLLRSPAVMRGYWRDAGPAAASRPPRCRGADSVVDRTATARVLSADGWLSTGDFGALRADGNLRLVGRDGEMYIRGGYNVYPAEVESVLVEHPGIAQAAVVGAPDPVLGQVGVAFVVPRASASRRSDAPEGARPPTLQDVRSCCRRVLADYKAPDALVVLDQLPLTSMMKVDRRVLAEQAVAAVAGHHRPEAAARRGLGPASRGDAG